MEEEWKVVTDLRYGDQMRAQYEASNLGRIRNARTKRIVQPHKHNSGYWAFHYRYQDKDGNERFAVMLWHRVIALTWIPNPKGFPQVDHIDRDVSNNAVSNLRWVTPVMNAQNTGPRSKVRYSRKLPAKVVDRDGNVIATYDTLAEACEVYGISIPHALEMLHGRRRPKKWGTFQQDLPK